MPTFLILGMCAIAAWAAVTDFREYLPVNQRTDDSVGKWNTILALFSQKAGDTMTGDLNVTGGNILINTAGKGLVIESGTAGAKGNAGQIAYQTGVLTLISNANVTANTRTVVTKADTTAPLLNTFICTNVVGVGVQVISAVTATNTLNYLSWEEQ